MDDLAKITRTTRRLPSVTGLKIDPISPSQVVSMVASEKLRSYP